MYYKLDVKLFLLWMLLLVQVLLVVFYLLMAPSSYEYSTNAPELSSDMSNNVFPVKFVPKTKTESSQAMQTLGYLMGEQSIILKSDDRSYFNSVNGTDCFVLGTDLEYMKRTEDGFATDIKCACKQGWHGRDCGQPEVIWRAFIASRQKIFPRKRRQPRHLVLAFSVINLEIMMAEIMIHELSSIVDLFIIGESNYTETGKPKSQYFLNKLQKGFLKEMQHKILYVPLTSYDSDKNSHLQNLRQHMWHKGRQVIKNLQSDDILIMVNAYEIPNIKALLFFKLYNGWPQPVAFRLKWTVYGFFWQHPKKTITSPGAWKVQLLDDAYHNNIAKLRTDPVTDGEETLTYGLVVGDLNHYGGWCCSWCLDPKDIVLTLQEMPNSRSPVNWDKIKNRKIDPSYIEDLIGAGLWLDSTTELARKSQYRDSYFAPEYVLNNTWKYDFLLTNFYMKLDYN
ncbi:beta-1,4-mannosyl-glycoprotein 4-beta-N-acetylglucosaminyltransferase [Anabrus simplex]|uniref:beta-1,4-mannosyl-glycoprotein 4-beta-N-acetylglucosaminyltransferase n=1 Tax=Anabrus simplex TaxID=316456 RepID=UPI0035A37B78